MSSILADHIAPSYMSPMRGKGGGSCGVSANEYSCTYLTYAVLGPRCSAPTSFSGSTMQTVLAGGWEWMVCTDARQLPFGEWSSSWTRSYKFIRPFKVSYPWKLKRWQNTISSQNSWQFCIYYWSSICMQTWQHHSLPVAVFKKKRQKSVLRVRICIILRSRIRIRIILGAGSGFASKSITGSGSAP